MPKRYWWVRWVDGVVGGVVGPQDFQALAYG